MSTPPTYVLPWSSASNMPVVASAVAQYAGNWRDGRPLYTYPPAYASDVAQKVTGVLGMGGYGLADPETGIQYGITEPRGGAMAPPPSEPDEPLVGPLSADMARRLHPETLTVGGFFIQLGRLYDQLDPSERQIVLDEMTRVIAALAGQPPPPLAAQVVTSESPLGGAMRLRRS